MAVEIDVLAMTVLVRIQQAMAARDTGGWELACLERVHLAWAGLLSLLACLRHAQAGVTQLPGIYIGSGARAGWAGVVPGQRAEDGACDGGV